MRLLVLGGTAFLGRAVVEEARRRGHELILFNRGKTHSGLFPEIAAIHGDRDGDLALLQGRSFDACIDTCGYVPRVVRQSARFLEDTVGLYAFVSTLSVYADPSPEGAAEEAALGSLEDPTVEEVTGETYGPLKALCEAEVEAAFPGRALVIRPGLIVGPHDPTDRFTYWPWRAAQGGQILAPGRAGRTIQWIDVRDLASWILDMLERDQSGTYNAVSTPNAMTMSTLISACCAASPSECAPVWVDDAFLVRHGVEAWTELPLWIPEDSPMARGFFRFSNARAVASGLRFRPVEKTVEDTMAWSLTRSKDHPWRGGLAQERERELLSAWLRES